MKHNIFYKAVRAIKVLIILGFITTNSIAQINNYDISPKTIPEHLIEIASAFEKNISFPSHYFNDDQFSIDLNGKSLEDALSILLKDTNIKYTIRIEEILIERYITFYGYVTDSLSGDYLVAAHVFDESSNNMSYTNENGFFTMTIPDKISQVQVSYIGYKSKKFKVAPDRVTNIELTSNNKINDILISDNEDKSLKNIAYEGTELLNQELRGISAAGGESDIFQYLYTQTGVQSGPDGFGGLHVRGGNSDQNLILLDGVLIYNPSHSFGLFSIFNTELIKSSQFKKSAFTSNNFGRTSSTLKIRLKEGNTKQWNTTLNQTSVSTNIAFSGPLIKNKLALSISGRKSIYDAVVRDRSRKSKLNKAETGLSNQGFYDTNFKLNWQLDLKNKFIFSYYKGNDNFSDESQYVDNGYDTEYRELSLFDANWSNQVLALNWNRIYNSKLFSNLSLSLSKYNYESSGSYNYTFNDFYYGDNEVSEYDSDFLVSINDYTLRYEFDYFLNNDQHLKFGILYSSKDLRPGVNQFRYRNVLTIYNGVPNEISDGDLIDNEYKARDFSLYFNYENKLSTKDHLNIGTNINRFDSENVLFDEFSNYWVYQLNLSYSRLLSSKTALSISADRMFQTMHLLTTSDIGFPNDIWVPSNEFIKPQIARQLNLSFKYNNKKFLTWNANLYYKINDNVLRYTFSENIPSLSEIATQLWEEEVESVTAYSRGVELSMEYYNQQTRLNLAYTLSKSDRSFDSNPNQERYSFEFDQRHRINLLFNRKISDKAWFYFNWNFATGLAQTIYRTNTPVDNLQFILPVSEGSSAINGFRLPNFHRLDVGIKFEYNSDRFSHRLMLGIQNLYNRANPIYAYDLIQGVGSLRPGINYNNALPIIPQLSYRINFKI